MTTPRRDPMTPEEARLIHHAPIIYTGRQAEAANRCVRNLHDLTYEDSRVQRLEAPQNWVCRVCYEAYRVVEGKPPLDLTGRPKYVPAPPKLCQRKKHDLRAPRAIVPGTKRRCAECAYEQRMRANENHRIKGAVRVECSRCGKMYAKSDLTRHVRAMHSK